MKSEYKKLSDTKAEISIEADESKLVELKKITLKRLQPQVSAEGFRKGKVPLNLVEKQTDENFFKSSFIDDALTALYRESLDEHDLKPLSQPEVEIKKFVPYTTLSFKVTVDVVPPIKLADYKKIKKDASVVDVTELDVNEVVENLRKRLAEKKPVEREARMGDEAVIDFAGKDNDDQPVAGASGNDYPLQLGGKTFIDGFEEEIVGLKAGDKKTFTLKFPKDYAHKPLANKNVVFSVELKLVNEVSLPDVDDSFASKVGPFKTVSDLKNDIQQQLTRQKEQESSSQLKDDILKELADKSELELPEKLITDNVESLTTEFKQNLVYRGITFPEYLKQASQTEEEFMEAEMRPKAELRVKTGLILAEISHLENIDVTPEELEIRLQLMRGQQQGNEQALEQLNDQTVIDEIASRMVTEKTIDKLVEYATK